MQIYLDLDVDKVQKALKVGENRIKYLHSRAAKRTAGNVRVQVSKSSMGMGDVLRRKKVPRARVKTMSGKRAGVWVGLNDISASEYKGQPEQDEGGVRFRGIFFPGAFIGRFPNDPRGAKRILRRNALGKLDEMLIPVGEVAKKYLEQVVMPQVNAMFNKNFEGAVDAFPHVRSRFRR